MGDKQLLTALLIVAAVILLAWFARQRRDGFRPLPVMTCAAVGRRDGFRPLPVSACAPYDDYYGVDMAGLRASPRDAAGTVAWDPYSTQSRVSLERYAETPEVATDLGPYLGDSSALGRGHPNGAPSAVRMNPVTGLGRTSSVRAMGDRYRRNEALTGLSVYELGPGDPGYMEEVGDTHAMSLMAVVARRSPPVAGGVPACLVTDDVDSDYFTDGYYNEAGILEPRSASAAGFAA